MIASSWLAAAATVLLATGASAERRGPVRVQAEAGGELLVLCEKSGSLARVDPMTGAIRAEVVVGRRPFALVAATRGEKLYVSCRAQQEVVELESASLAVTRRFPLRGDPTGLALSRDERRLYIGVHSLDQIAVLDLAAGTEVARLQAGNGPEELALHPRLEQVWVTNLLPLPGPADESCRSEVTVIDEGTQTVVERIVLQDANVARGIAFHSTVDEAFIALSRPKNLVPMVQVARGWVVTNGFARLTPDSGQVPVQLLVDGPNRAWADPYDVTISERHEKLYLSAAGANTVVVVGLEAVRAVVARIADGALPRHADHLGLSRRYVRGSIPVGTNPRGLGLSPDESTLYVANALDDSISVIDTGTDEVVRTLVLGEVPPTDRLTIGERLFHSAARTFQGQFSCTSCHPDGGFDGLRYDLEPDGLGRNLVDNRNLRAVGGTAPFKWVGVNPDIATQCGARTAKWIVRTGWLRSSEVVALSEYVRSVPAVHNPHAARDGALTAAQSRGKEFFERKTNNDGRPIPSRNRCDVCHSGPAFTNRQSFDVGTRSATDTKTEFDTAHLAGVFESAPYLHDGRAATLLELWTVHNPRDRHGVTSDATPGQLDDLVEYLESIGPVD